MALCSWEVKAGPAGWAQEPAACSSAPECLVLSTSRDPPGSSAGFLPPWDRPLGLVHAGPASGRGWDGPARAQLTANRLPVCPASETGGVRAAEDRRGAEGPVHRQPHQAGQVSGAGVPGGGASPARHPPSRRGNGFSAGKSCPPLGFVLLRFNCFLPSRRERW